MGDWTYVALILLATAIIGLAGNIILFGVGALP